MASQDRRAPLLLFPAALAPIVCLVTVLGPGKIHPVIGARVWGSPRIGETHLSLRVELMSRAAHVSAPAVLVPFQLRLGDSIANGTTQEDGVSELSFDLSEPIRAQVRIDISGRGGRFGTGILDVPTPAFTPKTAVEKLRSSGRPELSAEIPRGQLAFPFREVIRVTQQGAECEGAPPHCIPWDPLLVEASVSGGEVSPSTFELSHAKPKTLEIVPQSHDVELTLRARSHSGKESIWVGRLPVVPGAMWVAPASGSTLTIVSPVQRKRAYISLFDMDSRVSGAVVPLTLDSQQFYTGTLALNSTNAVAATLASDPEERAASTTTWPLTDAPLLNTMRVQLLFDSMAHVEAEERGRAAHTRTRAAILIGILGAAQIAMLLQVMRKEVFRTELLIKGSSRWATSRLQSVLLGPAVILLAFGLLAAVTVFWGTA